MMHAKHGVMLFIFNIVMIKTILTKAFKMSFFKQQKVVNFFNYKRSSSFSWQVLFSNFIVVSVIKWIFVTRRPSTRFGETRKKTRVKLMT